MVLIYWKITNATSATQQKLRARKSSKLVCHSNAANLYNLRLFGTPPIANFWRQFSNRTKSLNQSINLFFTFSSEKVLDLCKMWPPPFLSNVHFLRPPEPEKMVFTNVSVCLSVCLILTIFFIKRTVFVLIVKNVIKNQKFNFPGKLCDIRNKC